MGCVSIGKRSSSKGLLTCWGNLKGLTSVMSFIQREDSDCKTLGSMTVFINIGNAKKLYTCLQSTVAEIWNGLIYPLVLIIVPISRARLAKWSLPFLRTPSLVSPLPSLH